MQMISSKKNLVWILVGVAMIALALLLQSGGVRGALGALLSENIDVQNLAFLNEARAKSFDDALAFGEILAALEIVQSAEIGFSFVGSATVQVGQALAGLNFALEKALMASIAGAGIYEALILLVGLASVLNVVFFQLLLLAGAAHLACRKLLLSNPFSIACRVIFRGALVLFVSSFVLLPYSINVTGWLAQTVPFHSAKEHSENLTNFHAHVVGSAPEARSFAHWTKDHAVRAQFKKFEVGLPHTTGQTIRHAISIALGALFIGLLLPFCLFGGIWWMVRYFFAEHRGLRGEAE